MHSFPDEDSSKNAPKADVAQVKIELIAEDLVDIAGWMVSQLKVLPTQLAAADYSGMIYTLRRARYYWKATSGSAADLVVANDERLSALRQAVSPREGCRWRALPDEYGPYTTVFNRYNRWSQRGLWRQIFAALVECGDPPALKMIDSSAVKAHRSASGARKGGRKAKPLAVRAATARRKSTRSSTRKAARTRSC